MNEPWDIKKDISENELPHYYGDLVRKLFIFAAAIMLVTLPFFQKFILAPTYISVGAILIIAIIAGLTSPKKKEVAMFDTVASLLGTVMFEYQAVMSYGLAGAKFFFFISQILAILFFFAIYFSTKTLRGHFQK